MVANRKKKKLTKEKQSYLRGKLLERRTLLANLVTRKADEARRVTPNVMGDDFDATSDQADFEMGLGVATLESDNLADVEHALRKIEEGTYGRCEDCGCDIPEPRLRAMPFARLCVHCKENEERLAGLGAGRVGGSWGRVENGPASLENLERAAESISRSE